MNLTGKNYIGNTASANGKKTFHGYDPKSARTLSPGFFEATVEEMDAALEGSEKAFGQYREVTAKDKAEFLRCIADEMLNLGDELIRRAESETALPAQRLKGERGRTVNQLRMFADVIEEGSWVEASIDSAIPDREPIPKSDLRKMLIPLGPVVVFGASNFPLAFSVAGGDTASALAAGCPVVCKAHPAHPGTSELVARAILKAIEQTGMPDGTFCLLHGTSHEVGLHLVRQPLTQAIGFTGSLAAGRALFDAATNRPEPIPVYAEMGSVNPVFVLPSALKSRNKKIAEGLVNSITLGAGQFCTNPGLVMGYRDHEMEQFASNIEAFIDKAPANSLLYPGIFHAYEEKINLLAKTPGVDTLSVSKQPAGQTHIQAKPAVFITDAQTFQKHEHLGHEVFGPSSLLVLAETADELVDIARNLTGQLTATIHANDEDLLAHRELVNILQQKAGRLIYNSFPTGVEVCASMHHGGPYPACTDIRSTSVGTAAIKRFARPVCFQDFPEAALPPELQEKNSRKIWRMIDNEFINPNN